MEDVAEQQEENVFMTPGALLRQARQARRMTPEYVARELKLSLTWVNDLESDQYGRATAAIYVKGYLRAYARLVDLVEEEILAAFERMGVEGPMALRRAESEAAVRLRTADLAYMRDRTAQRSLWIWSAIIVFGLGAAMGILWWRGEHALKQAVAASVDKIRTVVNSAEQSTPANTTTVAIPPSGATETIPLSNDAAAGPNPVTLSAPVADPAVGVSTIVSPSATQVDSSQPHKQVAMKKHAVVPTTDNLALPPPSVGGEE